VDETIYCRHWSVDAADAHARELRNQGFEAKVEPDGERWLVRAHRDDKPDDAYTVTRVEAF
jgi:hypothetical protein